MATYSSILAWKILWTEEPGGIQSIGSQRVRHHWVTKHIACSTLHLQLCLSSNFSNNFHFFFFFSAYLRNCVCVWVGVCTHFCETFPLVSLLKSYSSRNLNMYFLLEVLLCHKYPELKYPFFKKKKKKIIPFLSFSWVVFLKWPTEPLHQILSTWYKMMVFMKFSHISKFFKVTGIITGAASLQLMVSDA